MNYSYSSPTMNNYSTSYQYACESSSPPAYYYSSMLPSPCPVHSSYNFYTTSSSAMDTSPFSHAYYQQAQVYTPPPVQQQPNILSGADRTPLRRHKCFKKNELQKLHQLYMRDPRPSTDELKQLASQLQTPLDKVRQWFKNRRHSDKQKKREISTARTSTTT